MITKCFVKGKCVQIDTTSGEVIVVEDENTIYPTAIIEEHLTRLNNGVVLKHTTTRKPIKQDSWASE